MTRDIGQERRSEFFRASKIAMDGGAAAFPRNAAAMFEPITADLTDVVNRYLDQILSIEDCGTKFNAYRRPPKEETP